MPASAPIALARPLRDDDHVAVLPLILAIDDDEQRRPRVREELEADSSPV